MGLFDQHARMACKLDGAGFFGWFLRRNGPAPPLAFDRWGDARRLAVVPGLERVDDLVAVLRRTDRPGDEVHLITEVEVEPRRHQLKRLGVYTLLLSIEESSGGGPEDEPPVGACLLILTGRRDPATLKLAVPGTAIRTGVEPQVVNLSEQSAARALAEIRDGTTARCILPWVPLLAGGGDRALVEEWKAVAAAEPDAERRATYGWFALVFAELTPTLVNWQQGLEGWEMKEPQIVLKVKREGIVEGQIQTSRAAVLETLRKRFLNPVPESLRLAVEGTNDPQLLWRWFQLALDAPSIGEFAATIATNG